MEPVLSANLAWPGWRVGAGELHCPLLLCASGKVANEAIVFAQWLCFGFVFFPSV